MADLFVVMSATYLGLKLCHFDIDPLLEPPTTLGQRSAPHDLGARSPALFDVLRHLFLNTITNCAGERGSSTRMAVYHFECVLLSVVKVVSAHDFAAGKFVHCWQKLFFSEKAIRLSWGGFFFTVRVRGFFYQ